MLIEIFLLLQVSTLALFTISFFTKNSLSSMLMWPVTMVLSSLLMFSSFDIGYYVYKFNEAALSYRPVIESNAYPYMMAVNMVLFGLSLIMFIGGVYDYMQGRI